MCCMVAYGQGTEISWRYEKKWDVSLDQYIHMINGKTAELFKCAAELGAFLAGADQSLINQMANIGREVGIIFQMINDYLDFSGKENSTPGREKYNDIRESKTTLVSISAIEIMKSKNMKAELNQFISLMNKTTRTDDEVKWCVELIHNTDAERKSLAAIQSRFDLLDAKIKKIDPGLELRQKLLQLSEEFRSTIHER